jgi:hypothetical protein
MTTFDMIREKCIKAQAERNREIKQTRKELIDCVSDSGIEPLPKKAIELKKLQNISRQARLNQITDKENKEEEFEPITQRSDRVEKRLDKLTMI